MKGFAAANEALARQAEQVAATQGTRSTFRFRLKPGETGRVVFLSAEPDAVEREHTVPGANGGYDNVVCPDREGDGSVECAFCAAGNLATVTGFFTVLHLIEYTARSGAKVINPVRTLAAKSATLTILGKYAERQKGLTGCVFDVSRSDKRTSPNVGDAWIFEEKITKAAIKELNPEAKPLDFKEELNYWTQEQIAAHASKVNVGRDSRSAGSNRSNAAAVSNSFEDEEATTTTDDIDW